MLECVWSGGQDGVDIAGLDAALQCNLLTGGAMPRGFKTQSGNKPLYARKYGVIELDTYDYPTRTEYNVKNTDATLRFAANFATPGEICTAKALAKYGKLHLDCKLKHTPHYEDVADWILENNIRRLNIAGNSEISSPGIYGFAYTFFLSVLLELQERTRIAVAA